MDPIELALLASGAFGAIGLLRRGATPVSSAGRAVMRAGAQVASPILQGTRHLPWPLRPLTSSVVTLSTVALSSEMALVVDGASTVLEAVRRPPQRPAETVPTQLGRETDRSEPSRMRHDAQGAPGAPNARKYPAAKRSAAKKSVAKKSVAKKSS